MSISQPHFLFTTMLLGEGEQLRNLPLKTNPSLDGSDVQVPLGRVCCSSWREAMLQADSTEFISQFHWKTPARTSSLPDVCCYGMTVFTSRVRYLLPYCVPQSSEANA